MVAILSSPLSPFFFFPFVVGLLVTKVPPSFCHSGDDIFILSIFHFVEEKFNLYYSLVRQKWVPFFFRFVMHEDRRLNWFCATFCLQTQLVHTAFWSQAFQKCFLVLLSAGRHIWFALLSARRRSKNIFLHFFYLSTQLVHTAFCLQAFQIFFLELLSTHRHIWFALLSPRRRSKNIFLLPFCCWFSRQIRSGNF